MAKQRSRYGRKRKTGTSHKGIDMGAVRSFGSRWTQSTIKRLGGPPVRRKTNGGPNFCKRRHRRRKVDQRQIDSAYESTFARMLRRALGPNPFMS